MTGRGKRVLAIVAISSAVASLAAAGPAGAAPTQTMGAPSTQRVGSLYVIDRVHQQGSRLSVSATVSVSGHRYRFRGVNHQVPPHIPQTVKLRLSSSGLAAVRRALRHGKRLSAVVTCTASNSSGRASVRKSIRLRP